MTQQVTLSGVRCAHCQATVSQAIQTIEGVTAVTVEFPTGKTHIEATRPITPSELREALKTTPQYQLQ